MKAFCRSMAAWDIGVSELGKSQASVPITYTLSLSEIKFQEWDAANWRISRAPSILGARVQGEPKTALLHRPVG